MVLLLLEKLEKKYPVASPSLYNIVSSILFALNSLSVKYFERIPATQMICWRSILTLTIITGLQQIIPNQSYPKSSSTMNKLILRGVIGSIGFITCFLSLKLVSVSEAVVLQKTNPLWTTLIVVYVLKKDQMTFKIMAEILICLLGVIFITKPLFIFSFLMEENQIQMTSLYFLGLCLALFTAMTTSIVQVLISSLSTEVSSLTILQYLYFFGIIVSMVYQLYSPFEQFQMVTLQEAGLLMASGLLGCLGQQFMNRSVMIGDVTQQSLIGQTQIIFNIILDIMIMNETIETMSLFGSFLIVGSLISNLLNK